MEFRPCIDIHNGQVKQIVGGTLKDAGDSAKENFVAANDSAYYARLYKEAGLKGGHVIMLNAASSEYYEATRKMAVMALREYPKGLQVGGGINSENAAYFINEGASHVIVTSYVFADGRINFENLKKLKAAVGSEHIVLDLSCRLRDGRYYVVTDRWQRFTDEAVNKELFTRLSEYCDEFLVHAVDVEGKQAGIDEELVKILSEGCERPVTYAGGIGSYEDIRRLKRFSKDRINATIGSGLDIFGGALEFSRVLEVCGEIEP